ncbi:hypothetical protein [Streptomyces peucetius]|uniref:Uncharacterized protein n=1 Tax=Streptomyces peucetius TaxID=1950 RepID=A0ABY6I9R3_STRPE|nr:hypothetical protein [Streptomyces peucetius]UYQ63734.1 hypothetical protein OGH68_21245 [Streptomyces peucetius]
MTARDLGRPVAARMRGAVPAAGSPTPAGLPDTAPATPAPEVRA